LTVGSAGAEPCVSVGRELKYSGCRSDAHWSGA